MKLLGALSTFERVLMLVCLIVTIILSLVVFDSLNRIAGYKDKIQRLEEENKEYRIEIQKLHESTKALMESEIELREEVADYRKQVEAVRKRQIANERRYAQILDSVARFTVLEQQEYFLRRYAQRLDQIRTTR